MNKNTIIAFIDDSKYSNVVCEYAAWLANSSKSKVKIYHVIDRKLPKSKQDLSGSINLGAKTKLLENLSEVDAEKAKILHSAGWSILEKAREKLKILNVKEVETRLRSDDIADALKAKEQDADVIVIGKRGELKQDSDSKLGQNIERLVRASTKPILIANREFMQIKKILVAFDGSPTSKRIIDFISGYHYFKQAEITLVSVGKKEDEIVEALKIYDSKIIYKKSSDTTKQAARDVFENKIIAWYEGKSEVGPRALGHRSLVSNPTYKDNWKRVNKIKEREWWRPFAPSVLEEEADKWFAKMPFPSPYMLFTGQVINSEKIPAITHVDNSSRIQTVNKSSGQYYQMIKEFYKLSKIPLVMNTSFNGPGEPIIETPEQALKFLLNTDLDRLYIDGYRVQKKI